LENNNEFQTGYDIELNISLRKRVICHGKRYDCLFDELLLCV